MQPDHLFDENVFPRRPSQPNPNHRWQSHLPNTERNDYNTLNIGRRHANIQKGIQQNGIGNSNIQRDEIAWRRGIDNTVDVQENVSQNGMGKMNDKSLRRINEMITKMLNDNNEKMRRHRIRSGNWNQQNNVEKPTPPTRNKDSKDDRKDQQNGSNQLQKGSCQSLQEEVDALKTILCKTISDYCKGNDKTTKQKFDKTSYDDRHGDRNSRLDIVKSAGPPMYNLRRSSSKNSNDYHLPVIFLPNYEVALK